MQHELTVYRFFPISTRVKIPTRLLSWLIKVSCFAIQCCNVKCAAKFKVDEVFVYRAETHFINWKPSHVFIAALDENARSQGGKKSFKRMKSFSCLISNVLFFASACTTNKNSWLKLLCRMSRGNIKWLKCEASRRQSNKLIFIPNWFFFYCLI